MDFTWIPHFEITTSYGEMGPSDAYSFQRQFDEMKHLKDIFHFDYFQVKFFLLLAMIFRFIMSRK